MKPHVISLDETDGYEFSHRLAGHHGVGINKSLDCVVSFVAGSATVRYEAESENNLICDTSHLSEAIRAYNAEPGR